MYELKKFHCKNSYEDSFIVWVIKMKKLLMKLSNMLWEYYAWELLIIRESFVNDPGAILSFLHFNEFLVWDLDCRSSRDRKTVFHSVCFHNVKPVAAIRFYPLVKLSNTNVYASRQINVGVKLKGRQFFLIFHFLFNSN